MSSFKLSIITIYLGRRQWQPTPVLLPGKFHGWRSLEGYSLWGHKELDTTERLHFLLSIVPFGEGNDNPLQCSCLENPMDRGACWGCSLWGCRELDTTKQLTHTVYLCQKKASSEIFGSMPKHFSVDDKIMPIL